jgi:phosphohistidine phosphatase
MLDLLLLRHAKSSWDDPGLDDSDRPLNIRGRRAAQAMGRVLASLGLVPALVLCSPARRARDTWAIAAGELKSGSRLIIAPALYDFGDGTALCDAIRTQGGSATPLLIVGHNPALEELALRLAGAGSKDMRARMARKFPTAALAQLRFDIAGWDDLADGRGSLERFIRPSDIMAGTGED